MFTRRVYWEIRTLRDGMGDQERGIPFTPLSSPTWKDLHAGLRADQASPAAPPPVAEQGSLS